MQDFKLVPVRFDMKMYNEMRDLAHVNKISMADIVRAGVDMVLQNSKKVLTKRDIAI